VAARAGAAALALALTVSPACLRAQVNIERLRTGPSSEGFAGTLALDLSLRAGNVSATLVDGLGRLDWTRGAWGSFLLARGDLGFANGSRYSNAGLAHARTARRMSEHVSLEAYVQANYDRARRLTSRALAGAGPRITVTRTPHGGLWIGTSAMLEHERWNVDSTDTHPRRVTRVRLSSYVSARAGEKGGAALAATAYVQPALADFGDLRALLDLTVGAPLTTGILLTASLGARYDSRPPAGVKQGDLDLKTGVTVTF